MYNPGGPHKLNPAYCLEEWPLQHQLDQCRENRYDGMSKFFGQLKAASVRTAGRHCFASRRDNHPVSPVDFAIFKFHCKAALFAGDVFYAGIANNINAQGIQFVKQDVEHA